MKQKISIQKIRTVLATLLAVILSVTFTFSDYSIVNAEITDNNRTNVTSEFEKELVQCDDWVIFKYKDENGAPQFDVKYQGKTVEKLKDEGYAVKYSLILKGPDYDLISASYYNNFSGKIELKNPFSNYPEDCFVKFILEKDNTLIYSDALPLIFSNDSSPYILFTNFNYLEIYHITDDNPSKFKVEMKVSEHLKKTGDLSISKKLASTYGNIEKVSTSNLTFENYNEENVIDGKIYNTKYSIVTFDLELPSKYFYTNEEEPIRQMFNIYIFSFNGIVGVNSNNPIENLQFDVLTPASLYDPTADVSIQSIKITSSSSSIEVGDSIKLSTTVLPNDATNKTLTWSSSNSDYATVDGNGTVTAKPAGANKSVVITAASTDGSNIVGTYTLRILPQDILVKSIKIKASSSSINAGKTIALKASINSDATNKSLAWSSSNTKYATVDSNGIVTTKLAGAGKKVTITAKATDGSNISASFNLKINKVLVKKIKLKAKKSLKVGKKLKIKLTINSDATNKNVKWSVSNKKYAKINSKGVLTAKKAGKGKTIRITVKAKDGSGKKATIKIKIK